MRLLLALLLAAPLLAQAPQIPVTGNVGSGGNFPIGYSSSAVFTSNSAHTMAYPETSGTSILVTSTVALTATQNLIAPLTGKFQFTITNNTTGGQAIYVVGSSGSGVLIPNGQVVAVATDGVNYYANPSSLNMNTTSYQGYAHSIGCSQPSTGLSSASNCLFIPKDYAFAPGTDFGYPGDLASVSGGGHAFMSVANILNYTAGINSFINSGGYIAGPGDLNYIDSQVSTRSAAIAGSDQGVSIDQEFLGEAAQYTAAISTGGTGATILTLTDVNNRNLQLESPLIDTTNGVLSGVTLTPVSGLVATTGGGWTVAASSLGTLTANISITPLVPNNTGKLPGSVVTFNVNFSSGSAPTTSTLCIIQGPVFVDRFKPSAVTLVSGTTYALTAQLYFSHSASGASVYCGGPAGEFVEVPANTINGQRYLEEVYGAPAANTVVVGHKVPQYFSSSLTGTSPITVNVYHGAIITGLINPVSGFPDGGSLTVTDSNAAWSPGDGVQNTGQISAAYTNQFLNQTINSPYATRTITTSYMNGYGGGLNSTSGNAWVFAGGGQGTNYVGMGGRFFAPALIASQGIFANGLELQYDPLYGANPFGCGGFFACSEQGPAPGSTSTITGWLRNGSAYNDSLTYDTVARQWLFSGSGIKLAGSQVCTAAAPCSGSGLVSQPATLTALSGGSVTCNGTCTSLGGVAAYSLPSSATNPAVQISYANPQSCFAHGFITLSNTGDYPVSASVVTGNTFTIQVIGVFTSSQSLGIGYTCTPQ